MTRTKTDKAVAAEALELYDIMQQAVAKAEKNSKLSPVFLKRDSFAGSAVSTGSLWLDFKLGGGIPPSRIVGISGPEKAGKTLLATQIAYNQLQGGRGATFFDAEGSNDPLFLKARGIDFNDYRGRRDKAGRLRKGQHDLIQFYQPSTVEEIARYIHDMSEMLPENRTPSSPPMIYFLDSVVALISAAVLKDMDSRGLAMHARAYSENLPLINAGLVRSGCTLVYTNQLRQKPGVSFGSPDYEPCGDALKFFSSMRLRLSTSKPKIADKDHPFIASAATPCILNAAPKAGGVWIEPHVNEAGEFTGGLDKYIYTAIKVIKNKVYSPHQLCWMRIQFEEDGSTGFGLDPVFDIFSLLYEQEMIRRSKAKGDSEVRAAVYEIAPPEDGEEPAADLAGEFGLPERFNYYDFRKWARTPDLVPKLRNRLLVSGALFNR
jgi:RecA/RadA recombinase